MNVMARNVKVNFPFISLPKEYLVEGDYPDNWKQIATAVKNDAGWKCEACKSKHGPIPNVLTVHHVDFDKSNCRFTNLVALCQRCHLKAQAMQPLPKDKGELLRRLTRRGLLEKTQLEFEI